MPDYDPGFGANPIIRPQNPTKAERKTSISASFIPMTHTIEDSGAPLNAPGPPPSLSIRGNR